MPSKRISMWLTDEAQSIVAKAPSVSAEINRCVVAYGGFARAVGANPVHPDSEDAVLSALNRYSQCWREAVPALASGEWMLICDALNSTWRSGSVAGTDIAHALPMEIRETAADGLGEKWGVDIPALADRLAALPFAARAAIIEVVDRFWIATAGGIQTHAELLAAAGARIAEK